MPTPSDLGYDPIIPLIHDTFMDHSPSGPVNLLDPSRTSPMKPSETFPNFEIGLSLYESYSPDHSGSPRDIPDPIPLSHDSLLIRGFDRRYLCIPSSTSLPISTLFLFPWYVIPCEPVTCLQANWMTFHREGPEYIYPSYGWTNPTLDPCVSTHTFRTLNATFIATQLRCGVRSEEH